MIHHPIYPEKNQDVTYTLENVSTANLKKVELYETISKVDDRGVETPGSEVLLKSWDSPGQRVDFTKSGGYDAGLLINYRFSVEAPSSQGGCCQATERYNQEVKFATQPYPVPRDPVPVYVVGDQGQVFDIVLIPDQDVSDVMDAFRENCFGMIRESFLDERTTQLFRRSFNFYINPYPGEAVDYETMWQTGRDHQPPENFDQISFAEGRVLMHKADMTDWTLMALNLYSTEMQNRGTILHESGHGLFELADEYLDGGDHWKENPEPNNWDVKADAESEAPRRGKSTSDVRAITDGWWKLCEDQCQMATTGLTHTHYDRPCQDRVIWVAQDIVTRGAP